VFGLLLVGCFRLPSSSQAGRDPRPAASAEATARQPRPQSTGQSLEGKFTQATMEEYVNAIMPMITQYLQATWPRLPVPKVIYVPLGAKGREECLDSDGRAATFSSGSYEYCGASAIVYVGQDMLWTFYDRTGDAGPAVGLAHEFGHHIQQSMGVPAPRTAEQSTRHENQADCVAGAWTRYTDEQGWLEYPDDIEDIDALFPLIGSAEGPDRDHGTASERQAAFQRGFDGGAKACNSFYPSTPLL
jgi:predicted metalloprotease